VTPQHGQSPLTNRHLPLTEHEKSLIRAASTQVWTWELRAALAMAVTSRGFQVGPYDSPGDLADFLDAREAYRREMAE
jgi:hypothetical protein